MRLPGWVVLVTVLGTLLLTVTVGQIPLSEGLLQGLPFSTTASSTEPAPLPKQEFIEITGGCDTQYGGTCVVARSAPSHTASVVARLRTGMVLKVAETIHAEDETWYRIAFDEWIRYPERIGTTWYIGSTSVRVWKEYAEETLDPVPHGSTTKRIVVDRSDETLTAYDGATIVMKTAISTGLDLTPTPRGTFTVYKKTPSRYMQGPLPGISDQYYDLPGVPWNLYFTYQGGVLHGAYWHDKFGQAWSHGCVNLSPADAKKLYDFTPVGTPVIVQD